MGSKAWRQIYGLHPSESRRGRCRRSVSTLREVPSVEVNGIWRQCWGTCSTSEIQTDPTLTVKPRLDVNQDPVVPSTTASNWRRAACCRTQVNINAQKRERFATFGTIRLEAVAPPGG
jgi:hypothetical protein